MTTAALTTTAIARMIDHSLLRPQLTDAELEEGCAFALKYDVATVCVRGYDVPYCRDRLAGSKVSVSTVTGFPHGNASIDAKVLEIEDVIARGATSVDVVLAVGKVRSHDWSYVKREVEAAQAACAAHDVPLKVIFENCYLDADEIARCSRISSDAGVAFVKTSTGYGTRGAMVADVRIMRDNIDSPVRIKAAGGIRTLDELLALYDAGATMFGTRLTAEIVAESLRRGM